MNTTRTKLSVALFIALVVFAAMPTFSVANATSTSTVTPTASFDPAGRNVVEARDYNDHVVVLPRGHVHVNLSGDGSTDVDIELFDANGNLVARSVGRTDDETICVNLCCPGYFTIRVKNLGRVYNAYQLWID